jgi:hypothetical protein
MTSLWQSIREGMSKFLSGVAAPENSGENADEKEEQITGNKWDETREEILAPVKARDSKRHSRRRCVCKWGEDCNKIGIAIAEAGDLNMSRTIKVTCGMQSKALRCCIEYHLKIPQDIIAKKIDYNIAVHHWSTELINDNFFADRNGKRLRPFRRLLEKSEAAKYGIDQPENNLEEIMKRNGFPLSLALRFKNGHLYVQAPTVTLEQTRMYVKSLTTGARKSIPAVGTPTPPSRIRRIELNSLPADFVAKASLPVKLAPSPSARVPSPSAEAAFPKHGPTTNNGLSVKVTPIHDTPPANIPLPSASALPEQDIERLVFVIPVNLLHKYIKTCFTKYGVDYNACKNKKFMDAFWLLRVYHRCFDPIICGEKLLPKTFLYPCRSVDPKRCLFFKATTLKQECWRCDNCVVELAKQASCSGRYAVSPNIMCQDTNRQENPPPPNSTQDESNTSRNAAANLLLLATATKRSNTTDEEQPTKKARKS